MVKTEEFKRALALAKPCLAGSDAVIPILANFCFDKGLLWTYDNVVGIVVDFDSGLDCALHGDTLAQLLEASSAESVTIKKTKEEVQLKLGAGFVKLPWLPVKDSPFELPEEDALLTLPIGEPLVRALQLCLLSASDESIKPEFAGVTCFVEKGKVGFFAGDNRTAARVVLDRKVMPKAAFKGCVLPTKACEQIVKLAGGEKAQLALSAKSAVASFEGVTLVTQLLDANVAVFLRVFEEHASSDVRGKIPEGLAEEITKASVLVSREAMRLVSLAFGSGEVKLEAAGALGQMESTLKSGAQKLKGETLHDPALIARALPFVESWSVNDGKSKSLVLHGEGFDYIISSIQR